MKAKSPDTTHALFDFAPGVTKAKPAEEEAAADPHHGCLTNHRSVIKTQVRSHQNGGVWLARRQKVPYRLRASYVYLLVHLTQNRFKIGKSIAPTTRFANLPEANEVDTVRSLQVILPHQKRAGEIESLLHKALAEFRLDHLEWMGNTDMQTESTPGWSDHWDGKTEWFALPALRHAIALLKKIPRLHGPQGTALQTLTGEPWPDQALEFLTVRQRHSKELEQYNLARFDEIFDVLVVISRQHRIGWLPSATPELSAGTLHIEGFKTQWEPDMITVRFGVTSSSLWELKTGRRVKTTKSLTTNSEIPTTELVCPLVKLIAYSKANPNDLELVFNSQEAIRKVPEGTWSCDAGWGSARVLRQCGDVPVGAVVKRLRKGRLPSEIHH